MFHSRNIERSQIYVLFVAVFLSGVLELGSGVAANRRFCLGHLESRRNRIAGLAELVHWKIIESESKRGRTRLYGVVALGGIREPGIDRDRMLVKVVLLLVLPPMSVQVRPL